MPENKDITRLLQQGNSQALDELFPIIALLFDTFSVGTRAFQIFGDSRRAIMSVAAGD